MKLSAAEIRCVQGYPDLKLPKRKRLVWKPKKAAFNLCAVLATLFVVIMFAVMGWAWGQNWPWG
jgi:hypothetical protein